MLINDKTASEIRELIIDELGFKYAVMLDGGHVPAMNASGIRVNIYQKQANIIQVR